MDESEAMLCAHRNLSCQLKWLNSFPIPMRCIVELYRALFLRARVEQSVEKLKVELNCDPKNASKRDACRVGGGCRQHFMNVFRCIAHTQHTLAEISSTLALPLSTVSAYVRAAEICVGCQLSAVGFHEMRGEKSSFLCTHETFHVQRAHSFFSRALYSLPICFFRFPSFFSLPLSLSQSFCVEFFSRSFQW